MCSNQLSYSGFSKAIYLVFGVQIYSKFSFQQNYCTIFSQKMYLCIIRNNTTPTMKKLIPLILFTIASLTAAAQPALTFTPDAWDFGDIPEAGGRVSHTFTGENLGDKPLVILDVVTTCGCTVPEFSRKPVVPGGRTQITVTYDPQNRPGAFAKELAVYSTERQRIATLTVRGHVVPRPRGIEELYPVDAGRGLRLSSTLCAFSYVYPGREVRSAIGFANTSQHAVRLTLRSRTESGVLDADYPSLIAPGERGEIVLAYRIPADKPRYGTLRDALEVLVDGRSDGTLLVAHGIGVDLPADTPKEKAPKAEISENILKFGTVKQADGRQRRSFTLSNTGGGELTVRAVENDGKVATTLRPGRRIAAGDSCRVEVSLDPAAQQPGIVTDHLVIITDDPARPMRRLRVTAVVEP